MSGIYYIVAKLKHEPDNGDLLITDEVKVSSKVEDAVDRIGGLTGDIYAVWSRPARPNPVEAETYMKRFPPEEVWGILDGWPFELADRYVNQVRGTGRG